MRPLRLLHASASLVLLAALALLLLPFAARAQDSVGTVITAPPVAPAAPIAPAFIPLALPALKAIPAKARGFCGQDSARLAIRVERLGFDTTTGRLRAAALLRLRGDRAAERYFLVLADRAPEDTLAAAVRTFCVGVARRVVPRDTAAVRFDFFPINARTGSPATTASWRASEWAITDPRNASRLLDHVLGLPLPSASAP